MVKASASDRLHFESPSTIPSNNFYSLTSRMHTTHTRLYIKKVSANAPLATMSQPRHDSFDMPTTIIMLPDEENNRTAGPLTVEFGLAPRLYLSPAHPRIRRLRRRYHHRYCRSRFHFHFYKHDAVLDIAGRAIEGCRHIVQAAFFVCVTFQQYLCGYETSFTGAGGYRSAVSVVYVLFLADVVVVS
ncbi:hypothetical protein BU25DRAFT_274843 [Macroventuria anomochaeta]|uniref:Uncharacterized protein n=1 Tax=Macroventuria anomochaeta TaxID=301207 RepID=A0ACB6S8Y5_9PLEO|nr:uncharacterized protein BU25DRAFT_274843 [Macroventuria anomochaeta]KAF2629819.1 hypothetical protein BU25DRAFT_274843 [Macroventuria anomochaeta]